VGLRRRSGFVVFIGGLVALSQRLSNRMALVEVCAALWISFGIKAQSLRGCQGKFHGISF